MRKINVYEVESNVPIESEHPTLPLSTLAVNDSVLFELNRRNSVQSQISRMKKRTGKEFTIRKVDADHARVWRTK